MAPEPEILKRKRSRPSDWWAAGPSPAPPQQTAPTQTRPGKGSNGGMEEAPAAGNRGKAKNTVDGDAGGDGGGEPLKPRRRGRPSGTMDELQGPDVVEGKKNNAPIDVEKAKNKKRGRPSAGDPVEDSPIVERNDAQRKRGRPTISHTEQLSGSKNATMARQASHAQPEKEGTTDSTKPRRKGSSSNIQDELEAAAQPPASIHAMGKKPATGRLAPRNTEVKPIRRGRSSNTEAEVQAVFEEATRTRTKQKRNEVPRNMDNGEPSAILSAREQDTRRTRRSDADIERPTTQSQKSTRGRHSGTVLEVQTAASSFGKDQSTIDKTKSSVKDRKSNGAAKNDIVSRKRKEAEADPIDNLQEVKRRRLEPPHPDEAKSSHRAKIPDYQHLTPVTRHVSYQKWEPLPQACIDLISQFLSDIQRPIVVRLHGERRKNQANTALQMVSRKLLGKISKGLPFPGLKTHREDEFDFEKILDRNRELESQLTPAIHSNTLLESELSRETNLLESEQAALVDLEANAKAGATRRKQSGRKVHSLLLSEESVAGENILNSRIGLVKGNIARSLPLDIQGSENLQAIFQELNGHLESMQGNIVQVQGIAEAVVKSKAAVQATLFDHLDGSQYEGVVLG